MNIIILIDSLLTKTTDNKARLDNQFWVWFDTNCGVGSPEWWWEEPGRQPLSAALDLAAKMRADGWIVQVMPDGMNPRPDGRWDNPE